MKYSENDERSSRLKKFGAAAATIALGAFALKESGNLKYVSKAFDDVGKVVKGVSKDLSSKAFKEYDYETISKTLRKNVLNDDSVWNIARKTTNNIELDFNKGLIPSVLHFEELRKNGAYLEEKMVDAMQKNEIVNSINSRLKNESGAFFISKKLLEKNNFPGIVSANPSFKLSLISFNFLVEYNSPFLFILRDLLLITKSLKRSSSFTKP